MKKEEETHDSEELAPSSLSEIEESLKAFGEIHLDPELTSFCLTLWQRMQKSRKLNTNRGKPGVWAASLVHVIGRMNFLYDKSQPIYISLGTICDTFGAPKTTVGTKATEIERALKLGNVTAGLCRSELMKPLIMLELNNGMVITYQQAEQMNLLPPGARPEDFC